MRKIIPIIAFISIFSYGQDLPTPEYYNQPYFLNDSNKLEKIERVDATYTSTLKGMGYGGNEMYLSILNKKSSKVFSNDKPLVFLIKLNTYEDPESFISMLVGTVKKKERKFIYKRISMMGNVKDISGREVSIKVEKLKDEIFKISVLDKLPPGEYAFKPFTTTSLHGNVTRARSSNETMYCFAIN